MGSQESFGGQKTQEGEENCHYRMFLLRLGRGSLAEIESWPDQHITNAIQQLEDVTGAEKSAPILNDVLEHCKEKITTVEKQWGDAIRRSDDLVYDGDRGPDESQWCEFCKRAWEGTRSYTNEQIQNLGARVFLEVLARIGSRCEHFRNELGAQLDHLKDVQGMIVGGVGNLAQAVGGQTSGKFRKE